MKTQIKQVNDNILYKKIKIKDLVLRHFGEDEDELSSFSMIKMLEDEYEETPNFISFLRENKSFSIEDCINQFTNASAEHYIDVLNEVISENRFIYFWDETLGYNEFGVKNSYMIDIKTNEKYYLG